MGIRGLTKRAWRKARARVLFHTGVLPSYRSKVTRGRATILLYHRVVRDASTELIDYSPSGMTVGLAAFDEQMAYVKANYDVVPVCTLVQRLVSGQALGERVCSVTFDDGWRDNFEHALPVLRRHGVPATIFLATNFMAGGPWFWEERFKYLVAHLMQRRSELAVQSPDKYEIDQALLACGVNAPELTLRRLPAHLSITVTDLRGRVPPARTALMDRLEGLLVRPGLAEPQRFLSWDDVAEMRCHDITFGAHTMSHANLRLTTSEECEAELLGCKAALEARLDGPVSIFAYPFGKHNASVRAALLKAGFTAAFTTRTGLVGPDADRCILDRIDISDRTAPRLEDFAARLLGLGGH